MIFKCEIERNILEEIDSTKSLISDLDAGRLPVDTGLVSAMKKTLLNDLTSLREQYEEYIESWF